MLCRTGWNPWSLHTKSVVLPANFEALNRLHQVANAVVAVTCAPIRLGRARPGEMLDVIHLQQVQQQQIGRVLLDHLSSHPRAEPITHDLAGGLVAPAGLPIDGDAFPSQKGIAGIASKSFSRIIYATAPTERRLKSA